MYHHRWQKQAANYLGGWNSYMFVIICLKKMKETINQLSNISFQTTNYITWLITAALPTSGLTFLPVSGLKPLSLQLRIHSRPRSLLLPGVCDEGGQKCSATHGVRVQFPTKRRSSTGPKTITHLRVLNLLATRKQCGGCHCYLL